MSEPKPVYTVASGERSRTIPQAIARQKLARRRVLINELVTIEAELMQCGAIKRPSVMSRRMIHKNGVRRPRKLDIG